MSRMIRNTLRLSMAIAAATFASAAMAACPKSITGAYSGTQVEDNGDGTKEFAVLTVTFGRASASGSGTGQINYAASGESGPGAELASDSATPVPIEYTYLAANCRGNFRAVTGDASLDQPIYFVVGENGNRIMGIYSDPSGNVMQVNQLTLFKQ